MKAIKKMIGIRTLLALAVLTAAPLIAADMQVLIQKYVELATEAKDEEATKKAGEEAIKEAGTDADQLNEFAWQILTAESIKKRDMALAMRVAKAANTASEGKSAPILDTLAKAFFDSGDMAEGIKLQKKAIELCTDDNLKPELEATLKGYEEKSAKAEKKDTDAKK